jgi:hypothetical protein
VAKSDARAAREWSLYWTGRGQQVPCRLVPLLSGWADLDQREEAADIGARHPILTDPESRIDPVLARFLARSRFTWLAEGTREAYAKDYRPFFSFLWQRGKYWHEADPDDLLDWEAWRRRGQPGQRIGGSKWQRELAALRLVYEWAFLVPRPRRPVRDGAGAVFMACRRDCSTRSVKTRQCVGMGSQAMCPGSRWDCPILTQTIITVCSC